ncbi:MAG: flavodoxin domain-containing protein [Thermoleophilia bacterium]|nr:flavodoxin domain-containing protein [Thermoleophilia bacterium]
MATVLVAYATKYGSTREVAERVAERLRRKDLEVEVRSGRGVTSVDPYDAVVFGGALYMFRLTREGRRFLRRHRGRLAAMPVAVFAMGPIEDTPEQFEGARGHLDKTLRKLPGVTPRTVVIFGGAVQPEKLKFPHTGMKGMPPTDIRDWEAIEAWADSLPEMLGNR